MHFCYLEVYTEHVKYTWLFQMSKETSKYNLILKW